MSEDAKQQKDIETKFVDLEGRCAPGIIDPLLARPLWESHKYAKIEGYMKIYCPTHQVIYDRIEAQKKLNTLDGTE